MLCCLTGATCTETSGCGSASFLEEHPASKTTGKNNRTRRVWLAKWDNLDGLVCVIRLEQLLLPWRPVKAQLPALFLAQFQSCHPDEERSTRRSGVDREEEGPLQDAWVESADRNSSTTYLVCGSLR